MRLSLWLLALTALSTGGCMFPCSNGACSSTGEPRYVTPAARFFGTEKLLPQTLMSNQCDLGQCQPSPYLTCSKYLPFMDKWTSSAMAKRCANRYLLRQQIQNRTWISKHYKSGFRDAFMDAANGESGEVPAVPPPKYWNTHYRTEKGKQCVELYFDGYRSGAVLAAAEMTTMKTVGASYDWSIEKPKQPCASSAMLAGNNAACSSRQGCSSGAGFSPGGGCSPGNPPFAGQTPMVGQAPIAGQTPTFPGGVPLPMGPQQFRSPSFRQMPSEEPSVFSVGPQPRPPASGIGPANRYPAPDPLPQQSPGYSNSVPNLPSPAANGFNSGRNLNLPSPGLPAPGYAGPGGNPNGQQSLQNQFSQRFGNQSGSDSQQSRPLTPGFSGPPKVQVKPGKLGPPDQFKSDPPAWQYRSPQQ